MNKIGIRLPSGFEPNMQSRSSDQHLARSFNAGNVARSLPCRFSDT